MPFNSYTFVFLFLPLTALTYWLLLGLSKRTGAQAWLLFVSAVFYGYMSLEGLATILPSILVDYAIARLLLRQDEGSRTLRRILLLAGIGLNLAFLGYFKYKNFFIDATNQLFATEFHAAAVILPLGISFLVFQKIAFLADVYVGEIKTIRLFDFLLFTLFFPRAIAGPIVHYQPIMPQLTAPAPQRWKTNMAVGICLFSIGLFKKTVIADALVPYVMDGFNDHTASVGMLKSWIALLAFNLQLYFDFSGYSDMALGAARMVGVRLPMNFDSPFKASSIVEFWSRWHITLTRFLTQYIYTPIVLRFTRSRIAKGKPIVRGRKSTLGAFGMLIAFPTLVTMSLSGVWHGAGWQFIAWGVLHGVYVIINQGWRLLRPRWFGDAQRYERFARAPGRAITFFAVMLASVFFRSDSSTRRAYFWRASSACTVCCRWWSSACRLPASPFQSPCGRGYCLQPRFSGSPHSWSRSCGCRIRLSYCAAFSLLSTFHRRER